MATTFCYGYYSLNKLSASNVTSRAYTSVVASPDLTGGA